MESLNNINAVILAGGKASRMGGTDKASIDLGGRQIIQRVAETLRKVFDELIIVTNTNQVYDIGPAKYTSDDIPYLGPLGGILAGLKAAGSDYCFVTACDMPFSHDELIVKMASNLEGHDIVVPAYEGKIEPLFGFYSSKCIAVIQESLAGNVRKVVDIYPQMSTLIIKAEADKPFFNVNDVRSLNVASKLMETDG